MAEVTQADVDAEIEKLNDDIQTKRGLPPIVRGQAPVEAAPTQEDVDAAIEKLNNDITAKKGAVVQAKEQPQPARPDPLPYIGGQAQIGAATGGHNIAAANQAELYSMGIGEPPDNKSPDLATMNKETYGGNGQVVAPGPVSRYVGAGVNALASNPFAAMAGGPSGLVPGVLGAAGAGMGAQAGTDAQPYLPESLRPYAPFLGGVLGGVLGAGSVITKPKPPTLSVAEENALRARFPNAFHAKDARIEDANITTINRLIDDQPRADLPGGRVYANEPPLTPQQAKALRELNVTMGNDREYSQSIFTKGFEQMPDHVKDNLPPGVYDGLKEVYDGMQAQAAARAVPPAQIDYSKLGNGPVRRSVEMINRNIIGGNPYGLNPYTAMHIGSALTALGTQQSIPLLGNAGVAAAQIGAHLFTKNNPARNEAAINALLSRYTH